MTKFTNYVSKPNTDNISDELILNITVESNRSEYVQRM